jgi:hypothetical protein
MFIFRKRLNKKYSTLSIKKFVMKKIKTAKKSGKTTCRIGFAKVLHSDKSIYRVINWLNKKKYIAFRETTDNASSIQICIIWT